MSESARPRSIDRNDLSAAAVGMKALSIFLSVLSLASCEALLEWPTMGILSRGRAVNPAGSL